MKSLASSVPTCVTIETAVDAINTNFPAKLIASVIQTTTTTNGLCQETTTATYTRKQQQRAYVAEDNNTQIEGLFEIKEAFCVRNAENASELMVMESCKV